MVCVFFFFKQKTAYEMRISDWSSDVCSSDLFSYSATTVSGTGTETPLEGPMRLDFPVYDADNHLYEAEDALTRHLPESHSKLLRFVEINGRKKLVVRHRITEYIPNPTFEGVAKHGAHMDYFPGHTPEGKHLRELT